MSDERITLRTHLFQDRNPDAACPICAAPSWTHDPGQAVLHGMTIVPPDSLDAARTLEDRTAVREAFIQIVSEEKPHYAAWATGVLDTAFAATPAAKLRG